MLNLFRPTSIVSDASAQWLEACFGWAATHFDVDTFNQRTQLVLPTNEYFPGRVDSAAAMATTVFGHVVQYSGLQHWPLRLTQEHQGFVEYTPRLLGLDPQQRGGVDLALPQQEYNTPLTVLYNPSQCLKPGDLAGYFASVLGQHLIHQGQLIPPGGPEYFAMAAEVIAVFMGFGVVLANSAYSFRGGCGSCYNAAANRPAALSETEMVHALALFCLHKKLPLATATAHLKPHLRRLYKRAYRYIQQQKNSQMAAAVPATVA